MKTKTHIYMANLLIEDLRTNKIVLPNVGAFTPPEEIRTAVINHPAAFRAGAVGPDFYPDLLLGAGIIHPEHSGLWLELMFKRLIVSVPAEREKNLAFTLGYMLHYAGDMFGHTYVNSYAGGWFPAVQEITDDLNKAKIVARHMLVETYMDQKVPKGTSMELSPPIDFICDVFTCKEAQQLMHKLNVDDTKGTNPLASFIKRRQNVHALLLKTEIGMTPGVTHYVQNWEKDVDDGIKTWLEAWNKTANIFAASGEEKLSEIKSIMENWFTLKYISMIGFPDGVGKVIHFINNLNILEPIKDFIMNLFKKFFIDIVKAILGEVYTTIEQAIEAIQRIFKDPKTYLDNGVLFSEKNISQKLDRDFGNYGQESNTVNQTFHAFYQCLNMSKLCLIGADNLNTIVRNASGNVSFQGTKFAVAARIGNITVQTSKDFGAGTDNNVYLGIRFNGEIYEALCDKPGYNDFERNDLDTYDFVVPETVDLSQVSAITARMSGKTVGGDWKCEWIQIKDHEKNVLLQTDNGAFWLSTDNTKEITKFVRKYNIPTKSLNVDPKVMSFLWSLDGKGKDNANPATKAQWEIDCPFYADANLRKNIFQPLFMLSEEKRQ